MASWEDGPEYAPLERPDDFLVPPHPPLSEADPYEQPARLAPQERPAFVEPPVPTAPLATLVPAGAPPRDPVIPFAVVTSTVTPTSSPPNAWSAAHGRLPAPVGGPWPAPTTPGPAVPAPVAGPWPGPGESGVPAPPTGAPPWPAPTAPLVLSADHRVPSHFPVPGTPGWFAPPPQPPAPVPPSSSPVTIGDVFAGLTPGLVICLVVTGLIPALAPLTLSIAALLAARARVAQTTIKAVFVGAMSLLAVVAALVALTGSDGFVGWWSALGWTAVMLAWVLLVILPLVVVAALRRGERPPPPPMSWG